MRCSLPLLLTFLFTLSVTASPPTDNPLAAYYSGDEGYPAWTGRIAWDRVLDMARYEKGANDFEKFEHAAAELSAKGGGVLYYPAGTYDFSDAPLDGPNGRGLMLPSGVVIRGQAPADKPSAFPDGDLTDLPTKFRFGFRKHNGGLIPRDWALIGLKPTGDETVADVDNVGICWVECEGATVYFGFLTEWTDHWSGGSWQKGAGAWSRRKADGTFPFDPFAGGRTDGTYKGAGSGRLVFGCVFRDAVVDSRHYTGNHHPHRFAGRVVVHGDRVFIGNTSIPKSKRVFKDGNVLYDYGKTIGIDVNKSLLGLVRDNGKSPGYFEEGIVLRDNYVYNHGNKGYEIAGKWVTIQRCRNERDYLKSGSPEAYGLGGWVLTLDGKDRANRIDDNMSRAFDLGGGPLWIDHCEYDSTGSDPGNDGEGILSQFHGGTHVYSWAATYNTHERDGGEEGYIGAYDVNCYGWLVAFNQLPGWTGCAIKYPNHIVDTLVFSNQAYQAKPEKRRDNYSIYKEPMEKGVPKAEFRKMKEQWYHPLDLKAQPTPPANVRAVLNEQQDAVVITWSDTSDAELGFRVDRQIDSGSWTPIAYRPPRLQGHEKNPQAWVDFTAPPGKGLTYRVVAINQDDQGPSTQSESLSLSKPAR